MKSETDEKRAIAEDISVRNKIIDILARFYAGNLIRIVMRKSRKTCKELGCSGGMYLTSSEKQLASINR